MRKPMEKSPAKMISNQVDEKIKRTNPDLMGEARTVMGSIIWAHDPYLLDNGLNNFKLARAETTGGCLPSSAWSTE